MHQRKVFDIDDLRKVLAMAKDARNHFLESQDIWYKNQAQSYNEFDYSELIDNAHTIMGLIATNMNTEIYTVLFVALESDVGSIRTIESQIES